MHTIPFCAIPFCSAHLMTSGTWAWKRPAGRCGSVCRLSLYGVVHCASPCWPRL